MEVGKNAKVQLCNFPKFDLVLLCVSSMGVKHYFHLLIFKLLVDSTEMGSNLEKSFNIHFLWLNNSNPQQFYMCNSKKMKTMINFYNLQQSTTNLLFQRSMVKLLFFSFLWRCSQTKVVLEADIINSLLPR